MRRRVWISRIAILPCALALALAAAWCSTSAAATILPVGLERDQWSDLAYPNTDSGSYNATNDTLSITTLEFSDLEIGAEFGPSNPGRHYGTGGTLGGPFFPST